MRFCNPRRKIADPASDQALARSLELPAQEDKAQHSDACSEARSDWSKHCGGGTTPPGHRSPTNLDTGIAGAGSLDHPPGRTKSRRRRVAIDLHGSIERSVPNAW
jgi:hypothetical protein